MTDSKMKYRSPRSLYNAISQKYSANRNKASNDVTELPAVMKLLGDLKSKNVLDMGCGLGKHAHEFIKSGANVTGYDASEKMVKITQTLCRNKGYFFRAEHETVSFEPSSFDVINASFTLTYSTQLDLLFTNVNSWLKPQGVFTFSIPHPVWLFNHVQNIDFSRSQKVWFPINSYDVEIFNYYEPLDTYIQLINKHNFKLLNMVETTISKKYKNWPEEKYRLPNAIVFKLQKEI
ncbi:MAG TPA: class I SAM-dependent methyltransferase [Vitreimonas sp.]|nr:class I SAM-dependent methyltransferase [Vitreimonas sp.]